jgi:hypothetical protein
MAGIVAREQVWWLREARLLEILLEESTVSIRQRAGQKRGPEAAFPPGYKSKGLPVRIPAGIGSTTCF